VSEPAAGIRDQETVQEPPRSWLAAVIEFMHGAAGWLLLFLVFLITLDVTGRYFLSRPITGTLEISEFLMVFVIFLSIASVQRKKGHIRVQLLTRNLPRFAATVLDVMAHILAIAFFLLIAWQAGVSAMSSLDFREASEGLLQIPIYPAKFAISIGSLVIVGQLLVDVASQARRLGTSV
jgi:TRAP-type C4-dicarboxylate transport system permease small subunit